jgi:hypothetical protein
MQIRNHRDTNNYESKNQSRTRRRSIQGWRLELGKIQEEYLDKLVAKVMKEKWIEGMDDTEIRDWLFDYCFNGWDINKAGFEDTFSESLDKCSKYEVE